MLYPPTDHKEFAFWLCQLFAGVAFPYGIDYNNETMRYKVIPEDFVVESLLERPPASHGRYSVYRVQKRGVTTLHVQRHLAARLGVRHSAVVFPALKDKDAVAIQYACVRGPGPARLDGPGYTATLVGRSDERLEPRHLAGNRFTVVLRDLSPTEIAHIHSRAGEISQHGLPNYFDEQRFGSYAPSVGFIGKLILQRDAEGALRAYLTQPFTGDPPRDAAFKALVQTHWGDWAALFEAAPRPSNARSVLTYLVDHPQDVRHALNLIPSRLLSLYLAAYQSYLWNRVASRYLRGLLPATRTLTVRGENLSLYDTLPDDLVSQLRSLRIPFLHHRAIFDNPPLEALVSAVLAEEGLTLRDFKARILQKAYLPAGSRALLLFPAQLSLAEAQPDDLFPGRSQMTVSFTLPRGSYATLVLKALGA